MDNWPGEDIQQRFGRAVRTRRLELGLTQDALAHRSGLHRTYLNEVELGKRNISLVNIEKLARALGIPVSELFRRWIEQPPSSGSS